MNKRDAIIIGLIIGLILGYTLRMKQVEPMLDKEISLLYLENKIVRIENEGLKSQLAAHQVNLKGKTIGTFKGGGKK